MIELNEQGGGTTFRVRVHPGAMRSRIIEETSPDVDRSWFRYVELPAVTAGEGSNA